MAREAESVPFDGGQRCQIFLCYRQVDGHDTAEWLYEALHDRPLATSPDEGADAVRLDVYYDVAAPAVGDWTAIHQPALERAGALILICSPGAYTRLCADDRVHRELDWWIENRRAAPILIDPTGEGYRWTPTAVAECWPNAQPLCVRTEKVL